MKKFKLSHAWVEYKVAEIEVAADTLEEAEIQGQKVIDDLGEDAKYTTVENDYFWN